jgi:hypothetical protein
MKNTIKGFGVLILYIVMMSIPIDSLYLFGINYNNLSIIAKQIYLIIYESLLLFIIFYIYKKDIINNFKDFKINYLKYIKKYYIYWFIMLFLMILSNKIITIFTTTNISENEQIIIKQLNIMPIYILITTILISPILEELVFRISFKKMFPNTNIVFILSSGIMFGFIHVIGSINKLIDLLFIIPYSIPGFIFAYLYTKSNNIFVPISIHIFHNLIMMLIQII